MNAASNVCELLKLIVRPGLATTAAWRTAKVFAFRHTSFVFDRVKLRCSSVQSVHMTEDCDGVAEGDWTLEDALLANPVVARVTVDRIGATSESRGDVSPKADKAVVSGAVGYIAISVSVSDSDVSVGSVAPDELARDGFPVVDVFVLAGSSGLVLFSRSEMSKQVLRTAIDTYSGHVQFPYIQEKDTFWYPWLPAAFSPSYSEALMTKSGVVSILGYLALYVEMHWVPPSSRLELPIVALVVSVLDGSTSTRCP